MPHHQHFLLNKPHSYLSQFVTNQNTRRNKQLLGELGDFPEGIMAIGRLDENSEGLLLLTSDGKVSERVRSKSVEKEYYVQLNGIITDEAITQLATGIDISIYGKQYKTLPCSVSRLNTSPTFSFPPLRNWDERHGIPSWISITISEGKYRQIRKMCAAVGYPVIRLVRIRIGNIQLGNLPAGGIIEVQDLESLL